MLPSWLGVHRCLQMQWPCDNSRAIVILSPTYSAILIRQCQMFVSDIAGRHDFMMFHTFLVLDMKFASCQAWCSDNSDAFSRTRIQMGTSMWVRDP